MTIFGTLESFTQRALACGELPLLTKKVGFFLPPGLFSQMAMGIFGILSDIVSILTVSRTKSRSEWPIVHALKKRIHENAQFFTTEFDPRAPESLGSQISRSLELPNLVRN